MDLQTILNTIEEFLTTPNHSHLLSPDQKPSDKDEEDSEISTCKLPGTPAENWDTDASFQTRGPNSKGILSEKYLQLYEHVDLHVPNPPLSPLEFDPKTFLEDCLWGSAHEPRNIMGSSPEMYTPAPSHLGVDTSGAIDGDIETKESCTADLYKEVPNVSQLLDCGKAVMADLMDLLSQNMRLQEEASRQKVVSRKRELTEAEEQSSHRSKGCATVGYKSQLHSTTASSENEIDVATVRKTPPRKALPKTKSAASNFHQSPPVAATAELVIDKSQNLAKRAADHSESELKSEYDALRKSIPELAENMHTSKVTIMRKAKELICELKIWNDEQEEKFERETRKGEMLFQRVQLLKSKIKFQDQQRKKHLLTII